MTNNIENNQTIENAPEGFLDSNYLYYIISLVLIYATYKLSKNIINIFQSSVERKK